MNEIVVGSIQAIAQQTGKSIAESFMNADVLVLVDTSGSMDSRDSRAGHSRYEVAVDELARLQNDMPGKIAVVSFSSTAIFCPHGIPTMQYGSTNLAGALQFARVAAQTNIRFIIISDGEPDSEQAALDEARCFRNRIDVVYVGPEDRPYGRDFLTRLAALSGGRTVTADRAKELAPTIQQLLLTTGA